MKHHWLAATIIIISLILSVPSFPVQAAGDLFPLEEGYTKNGVHYTIYAVIESNATDTGFLSIGKYIERTVVYDGIVTPSRCFALGTAHQRHHLFRHSNTIF